MSRVKLGIDNIDKYLDIFENKKVGLITNPTGIDSNFNSTIDLLKEKTNLVAIGAPWLNAYKISEEMNEMGLPGVKFRPVYFTPTFSKHSGDLLCKGGQIHITSRKEFKPVITGLSLLFKIR